MTLIDRARQIKTETRQGANTAERVGGLLTDICTELNSKATSLQVTDLLDTKVKEMDTALADQKKVVEERLDSIPKDILTRNEIMTINSSNANTKFIPDGVGFWSGKVGDKVSISILYNYRYKNIMKVTSGDIVYIKGFYKNDISNVVARLLNNENIIVKNLLFSDMTIQNTGYKYTIPANISQIGLIINADGDTNGMPISEAIYNLNYINGDEDYNTGDKIKNELLDIRYIKKSVNEDITSNTNSIYLRGLAKKEYTTKKIAFITAGQSNSWGPNAIVGKMPASFIDESGSTIQYMINGSMPNTLYCHNDLETNLKPFDSTRWAYDAIVLRKLSHYLNQEVLDIKWAVGGTGIDTSVINNNGCWTPRFENIPSNYPKLCSLFEQSIRNGIAKYGESYEIKAFLWHQGETDCISPAQENYYKNFWDVINYIRGVVANPILPVIFGSISHKSEQYSKIVEDAQKRITSEDNNIYMIDMSDADLADAYHFNTEWMEYLGEEMYTIIKTKIL